MMIQGTAKWAKIVGKAAKAYTPGEFEWSIDVFINEKTKQDLLAAGCDESYIKNKGDGDFVQFKRRSITRTGEPAKPIVVLDRSKNPWPVDTLIGNGSVVNVKFLLNEITHAGKQKMKPSVLAIQVWELHEYVGGEQFPTDEEGAEVWDAA